MGDETVNINSAVHKSNDNQQKIYETKEYNLANFPQMYIESIRWTSSWSLEDAASKPTEDMMAMRKMHEQTIFMD